MVRVFFSRGGRIVSSGNGYRPRHDSCYCLLLVVMVFVVCHLASLNWLHCNHGDACGNVV
jgi:hypothetical protein